jgi:Ca2+:H+ antiporter
MKRAARHLAAGWGTVIAFLLFGDELLSKGNLDSVPISIVLFVWILGVILWCAFGVIVAADHLAEMLGEPFGTLILTFSIVAIEVMLISSVMLGGDAPTVGRDTMFAVMMIVLNGVVGLSLVIGGLKHHEQGYSLPGASAFLSVIIPLGTIALIMPAVTSSTDAATLTTTQAVVFAGATIVLYVIFLVIQTGRHRDLFVHGASDEHEVEELNARTITKWVALLLAAAVPIVLLSKNLDKVVKTGIEALGAPVALSGILIALIVFTPEGISALKAAYKNQLQRTVNLCLGACLSTLGLTLPAVLIIGLITGQQVILGLDQTGVVLVALTLLLSVVTFSGPRTTVLEGAVHLLVFFIYIVLVFSP